MQQRYLEQDPVDGQEVICHGRLSVYEPRGDYQLIVDTIDFHGAGALWAAFERLKRKLDQEGLFHQDAKSPLPHFQPILPWSPHKREAAVHDFYPGFAKRGFPREVTGSGVYPRIQVQGRIRAAGRKLGQRPLNLLVKTGTRQISLSCAEAAVPQRI